MKGKDPHCHERSKKEVSKAKGTTDKKKYEMFAQVEGERRALMGHVGSVGALPGRGTSRLREERWHAEDIWWKCESETDSSHW